MASEMVSWTSCGVPLGTVMKPVLRDLDVEALLGGGRHVGEELDPLGAEDGQRDDLAGLDVLDGLADLQAGGVDLVAEERGQRRRTAVERDRLGRGVVDVEGQRAGELGAGADAGGAVGDLLVAPWTGRRSR